MSGGEAITERDLRDLIDGRLDPEREHQVRVALGERPDLASIHQSMLEQDRMLRSLGQEVLSEPVPDRLLAVLRRTGENTLGVARADASEGKPKWRVGPWPVALSSGLAMALGLVLGWFAHLGFGAREAGLFEDVVRQAALSHKMIEATEPMEPLDLQTGTDVLPVADLPQMFGAPVRAPTLSGTGWTPVGLKTEVGSTGRAMQVAYADPEGRIVTLYVRPISDVHEVPVELVEAEGFDLLYWVDGPLIYALVGDTDEAPLQELARRIYAAPATGGAWSTELQPAAAQPDEVSEP